MPHTHKLSKLAVIVLVSEILVFLMGAGLVLTEIVFPLSANEELAMFEQHKEWSPRPIDNVVVVFFIAGTYAVFALSLLGLVIGLKKCSKQKKIPAKRIVALCVMAFNLVLFGVFGYAWIDYFLVLRHF